MADAPVTSLAGFRSRFGEFAAKSDADVQRALDTAFAVDTATALAYWVAAHILVLDSLRGSDPDGGAYPLASESLGGRSNSYQLPESRSHLDAWLMTSEYGRRYLALREASPRASIGMRVIG